MEIHSIKSETKVRLRNSNRCKLMNFRIRIRSRRSNLQRNRVPYPHQIRIVTKSVCQASNQDSPQMPAQTAARRRRLLAITSKSSAVLTRPANSRIGVNSVGQPSESIAMPHLRVESSSGNLLAMDKRF